MNKQRVQDIRDIMASLIGKDNIDMTEWQQGKPVNTIAGVLALSEQFQAAGGYLAKYVGRPVFESPSVTVSVQKYLDISHELARCLVTGDLIWRWGQSSLFSRFYNKPLEDVKAEDVVEKLDLILNGELA